MTMQTAQQRNANATFASVVPTTSKMFSKFRIDGDTTVRVNKDDPNCSKLEKLCKRENDLVSVILPFEL